MLVAADPLVSRCYGASRLQRLRSFKMEFIFVNFSNFLFSMVHCEPSAQNPNNDTRMNDLRAQGAQVQLE